MTLSEFETMVRSHDLTHDYSDDNSVWRRGKESLGKIRLAAKNFMQEDVVRIWNAEVDRCLAEGARDSFYWK